MTNKEIKSKKKLIIISAIVAIGIIGLLTTGEDKETDIGGTQEKIKTEKKEKPPAIIIDAQTIIADYEANELLADDKYKGKYVEITGVFESVSDTLSIKTMQLTNGADILDDNYTFVSISVPLKTDANINLAKGLIKGNNVTVRGTVNGYTGLTVDLKNDATILK